MAPVPPVHPPLVRSVLPAVFLSWVACGGGADPADGIDAALGPDARPADAAAGPDSAPLADATPGGVPDPGNGPILQVWPDTEPNDTPEQAVPVGVGRNQIGPYVGLFEAQDGHLGPNDPADHFVFRTAADVDTGFIAGACWADTLGVNLLDFALYKVVDGQPLQLVKASTTTDKVCERQMPFQIPLERGTKYLFSITRVEGEGDYEA